MTLGKVPTPLAVFFQTYIKDVLCKRDFLYTLQVATHRISQQPYEAGIITTHFSGEETEALKA